MTSLSLYNTFLSTLIPKVYNTQSVLRYTSPSRPPCSRLSPAISGVSIAHKRGACTRPKQRANLSTQHTALVSSCLETLLHTMTQRAPFQVLVLPFRNVVHGVEYATFQRSDNGHWQAIAGGGESGETPVQAASREAFEEANIPGNNPPLALDTCCSVPVCHFPARKHWPRDLLVIPEYCFAIDCTGINLQLSDEHTRVAWSAYKDAYARLFWDSNRTALWEHHERLQRGWLGRPSKGVPPGSSAQGLCAKK